MPTAPEQTTTQPASEPAPISDDLRRDLAAAVRGDVRFSLHDRLLYATDASIYQVEPLGVVIPDSTEDAAAAVRFAAGKRLPILPRGGGTSLAGQCTNRAVVLDLSARCTGLLQVSDDQRSCRVEAGITIGDLNDQLRNRGVFFAPDPSTARHATVAGCIGNNAAGSRSVKYGRTTESLLGIDAVLASGERVTLDEGAALRDPIAARLTEKVADVVRRHADLIRERFPKTRRRNAGYALDLVLDQIEAGGGGYERVNLAHLLCGSEGTLAITLGAELALHPIPTARGLAVISFPSLDAAMDAVVPLLELSPSAVELLDDLVVSLARDNLEHRASLDLLPSPPTGQTEAVLYVEFEGTEDDVVAGITGVRSIAAERGLADAVAESRTPSEMDRLWALRKAGEPLLHAVPGDRKPLGFIEDGAIPPERLPEFVTKLRAFLDDRGTRGAFYAHASVGVLHVRPLLSLRSESDKHAMEEIATFAADLARDLGGVMSGEHGDGRARGPMLERFYGPELMAAFREIKSIFDPLNLLNPGNIVEPGDIPSIHGPTRIAASDTSPSANAIDTYYDYSDQHGFEGAVEMCNGAGVCRKKTGGVMCPSYMATLDERHSTRGRGNALRLAISGQSGITPGSPAWGDPETKATLDLCLSCKACKAECPSNVDIARLKAEYQAQTYDATGKTPLRARAFGHIHALNKLAGIMPWATNLANRLGRPVINALLGLHPQRSLPRFETPLHRQWPTDNPSLPADAPVIALYADTFTSYNEPGIGLASKQLLEAFGYRVRLIRGTDAGRALMSTGLLADAIKQTDAELRSLEPIIHDGAIAAVLFCEPSVLSAVKDDWLLLKLQSPDTLRRQLAAKSWLVEDFIATHWDAHPQRPSFTAEDRDIILHGHCHQKSLWGAQTSAGLLERLAPGRVRTLDTTCCGLAGSFGYTRERFELSMNVGELGVLPAARAAGDALVCAPGTSCRHQIKDGAGVRALHPVEAAVRMFIREPDRG